MVLQFYQLQILAFGRPQPTKEFSFQIVCQKPVQKDVSTKQNTL